MYPELTDEQLLEQYLESGNDRYVSALYTRYVEMIYGVSLKYFKDANKAKDATSEIYLLLLRRMKGKQIEQWKPWLYTVVKNYCLEQLRSRSGKLPKQLVANRVYSDQVYHPYSEKGEKDLNSLEQCISLLPDEQRLCITLFYLEKKSYQELTDQLMISWSTVRSRIQNGRRNLKKCMSKS